MIADCGNFFVSKPRLKTESPQELGRRPRAETVDDPPRQSPAGSMRIDMRDLPQSDD